MTYKINTSNGDLDWKAGGDERVIQNVINLINTYRYEVAYDRTLGISKDFIDMPGEEAKTQAISEIMDLIDEREQRATIVEISDINIDDDGNINIRMVIDVE
jgi:hypothetical protein